MFGFLGFLLIIFLLVVFIGLTILSNILRVLFGIGKHTPYQSRTSTRPKQDTYTRSRTNGEGEDYAESASSPNRRPHSPGNRKKIFADDEGEYVDYEEVK